MPDAFFASTRKRKRSSLANPSPSKKLKASTSQESAPNARPQRRRKDEELSSGGEEDGSIGDMELRAEEVDEHASGEEDIHESAAEKRLRLAKLYLESVKNDLAEGEFDAADLDRDIIMSRLQQDVLQQSNKVYLFVADKLKLSQTRFVKRGHRLSVTGAVATEDGRHLFTCGKEGDIIQWDLHTSKQIKIFKKKVPDNKGKGRVKGGIKGSDINGHTDELWAIAISSDGRYLATGGKDRKIGVWDVQRGVWIKGFGGHKDSISSLAFRKGTQTLFSASYDRSVKLHDLSILGYVETLFGHQDKITSLDALRGETALTSGGRDKTVRYWKVAEETQVVFRGGAKSKLREVLEGALDADGMDIDEEGGKRKQNFVEGSMECVAMVDESTFLSGGDSGTISLWNTSKKKPVFNYQLAHGLAEHVSETEGKVAVPRWITSIAALPYSDFFVSGSWDGHIRLWHIDSKLKSFEPMSDTIRVQGVVNSLQVLQAPKTFPQNAAWTAMTSNGERNRTGSSDEEVEHSSHDVSDGISNGVNGRQTNGTAAGKESRVVLVVAAIGQEPRTGRWVTVREGVKNCALVVPLYVDLPLA